MLIAAPFLHPGFFPLTWIALVPLLWLVWGARGPLQAFLLAWLVGALANLLGFYWVDHTVRVFGGFPHGLSEFILLLFAASASLPIAVFGPLARLCGPGPLQLFPALLWVAIEFSFPQLFPWHLANSQSQFLALIQSADLVGPYGTSFLLVWFNSVFYTALFSPKPRARSLLTSSAVIGIVMIGDLAYGHFRLKGIEAEMRASRTLDIAAIQGSIDIRYKWNLAFLESNLKSYLELTRKSQDASLFLWPESAVEAWLPEEIKQLPAEIVPVLPQGSSLIFGVRSFRGNPDLPGAKAFNSAFLVDSEGRVQGRYHKQVLLAFGEYIPFAPLLSKLPGLSPIGEGFSSGEGPRTLDLPGGIRVAPLICYEDIMPELARRFVGEKGADLLVNLTNDAWFGDTVAPWQHARLAQWRAIETRRTLVRVTNTGVTTVINPKGEMLQALPTFSPGVLTTKVEIMSGETPYVRFGDWVAWTMLGASALIILRRWNRSRSLP